MKCANAVFRNVLTAAVFGLSFAITGLPAVTGKVLRVKRDWF